MLIVWKKVANKQRMTHFCKRIQGRRDDDGKRVLHKRPLTYVIPGNLSSHSRYQLLLTRKKKKHFLPKKRCNAELKCNKLRRSNFRFSFFARAHFPSRVSTLLARPFTKLYGFGGVKRRGHECPIIELH